LHRFNTPNTWRETLNPQTLSGGFFYAHATQLFTHAKKRLERAFIAFGGHILAQSEDGLIKCLYLIHFSNRPRPFLAMPTKQGISVAINA
jgi:hypothetical protein